MSWSRRGVLRLAGGLTVAGLVPALGACGFRPVYGTGEDGLNGRANLEKVDIAVIPDRAGQMLRNHLIDRFYRGGYPVDAPYRLDVSLTQSTNTAAIRPDQTTDRLDVSTSATFKVVEKKTGRVVFTDSALSRTAATGLRQQYAYLAGVQAAGERTLIEIADEITMRTAVALGSQPTP